MYNICGKLSTGRNNEDIGFKFVANMRSSCQQHVDIEKGDNSVKGYAHSTT